MGDILGAYKDIACCCSADMDQMDTASPSSGSIDELLLEGANTTRLFMYANFRYLASHNDVI